MKTIKRENYLNRLIALRDTDIIKVITGIRRCGKSTLMRIYQDYLIGSGVSPDRIVSINLEDYDYLELREPNTLHAYIKEHLSYNKMTYVFIDEIQHCKNFPDVINSLNLNKYADIYLTGSNAYMLSSEIATLISGRYIEIQMMPLSFKEYLDGTDYKDSISKSYQKYIEYGSFPYTLALDGQSREISDYLEGIYNTIVVKDISNRKKIQDTMMLESITRFLMDNIGNPLSSKKIADTMTSDGRKIDAKTVEKYISGLRESFVFYQAKRYNIKGKQYLKTLEKYYTVDMGLRFMLLGKRGIDVGHILENIIYLELLRRGYDVYVGQVDNLEVDFVAMNSDGNTYFQVSASVRDEKTLNRELASLKAINDNYPKYILTLDDDPNADYEGIRRINALEWLAK